MAVVLGFFHVWADRHYLTNSDAMSYLDVAEAYLSRDWQGAINAYWSPLYSWVIAVALAIAKPSPYWKFATLHLVNFAIYLFALGSFGLFINEVVRRHRDLQGELHARGFLILPDWALLALGYSLFIWSTLFLITVQLESPDLLVAAFIFLASWILLRIRWQPLSWGSFALLGAVLGFGYLAKTIMLPMAVIFIVASTISIGNLRQAWPRILVTIALFVLVAGPFVFAISRAKGRLTFGDSGRLNYIWAINRVPFAHWQGKEPRSGEAKHPTRKIYEAPPVYEFGEPIGGTYPVWYDPTYWYEGARGHFDLSQQLRVLAQAAKSYYELFHKWGLQYGLLVGFLSLYLLTPKRRLFLHGLRNQWNLLIPAIAGFGLYALVNVQGRYVASSIVLFWLTLFAAVRVHKEPDPHRYLNSVSIALVACIVFTTVASSSREVVVTSQSILFGEDPSRHEQWQVAEGLRERGVTPNDRMAFIGHSFRAFWAHLLGVKLVAEIPEANTLSFWEADASKRDQVINAFARTGAKALVAEKAPPTTDLRGWQRIRQTNYYVYMLNQ
jgi:hypothetical protein